MAVTIERTGMLLIISGPSGTGKGTLVKKLMDHDPSFLFSCSVTTSPTRGLRVVTLQEKRKLGS